MKTMKIALLSLLSLYSLSINADSSIAVYRGYNQQDQNGVNSIVEWLFVDTPSESYGCVSKIMAGTYKLDEKTGQVVPSNYESSINCYHRYKMEKLNYSQANSLGNDVAGVVDNSKTALGGKPKPYAAQVHFAESVVANGIVRMQQQKFAFKRQVEQVTAAINSVKNSVNNQINDAKINRENNKNKLKLLNNGLRLQQDQISSENAEIKKQIANEVSRLSKNIGDMAAEPVITSALNHMASIDNKPLVNPRTRSIFDKDKSQQQPTFNDDVDYEGKQGKKSNLDKKLMEYAKSFHPKNKELAEKILFDQQKQRLVESGKVPKEKYTQDGEVAALNNYVVAKDDRQTKKDFLNELTKSEPIGSLAKQRSDNTQKISDDFALMAEAEVGGFNFSDANQLMSLGTTVLDIGLGFVPGVSLAKDIYELCSGANLVTGQELSTLDRSFAAVGVLTLGYGDKLKVPVQAIAKIAQGEAKWVGKTFEYADRMMKSANDLVFTKSDYLADFVKTPSGKAWGEIKATGKARTGDGIQHFDLDARAVNNALPENGLFARIMPREHAQRLVNGESGFSKTRLDEFGNDISEAFITKFDDIANIRGYENYAERLTLTKDVEGLIPRVLSPDDVIVKFRFQDDFAKGIQSPIDINNMRGYGFEGIGKTKGGASEWIIDNNAVQKGFVDKSSIEIMELVP